ncbi:MAG: hypothetical protein DI626_03250 [Micavibrio aeruginosavorus]|uniref:HD-GYP domain-containing protein n=1 Tax=Micavibrio aeruginosavorus TaxID=349221 RepID=A0A2W5A3F0_9BACT|nr:MAG: hypothetical protein DI626_03250 [Micavibrio aeruginosavorus]
MGYFEKITPLELEDVASSYVYDTDLFRSFEKRIWSDIRNYGGDYGHTISEHLGRTSSALASSMTYSKWFDHGLIRNIGEAFRNHDAGKILQDAMIYNLPNKPDQMVLDERKMHVFLGEDLLNSYLDTEEFRHLSGHPHLSVTECIMRHHHERINGTGPVGLEGDELGELTEIIGIIDSVDGKAIPRANRTKSMAECFREMTGLSIYTDQTKHKGEFRHELLVNIAEFLDPTTFPPGIRAKSGLAFA